MNIILEKHEVLMAAFVGAQRRTNSMFMGATHLAGYKGDAWSNDIQGAAGEVAVAKALNKYWEGATAYDPQKCDVGGYIDVRTRSQHNYDHLIRPADKDHVPQVLVTGMVPNFVLRGWLYGGEAKREEWLQGHGGRDPAYFVPQRCLRSIPELMALTPPT